MAGKFELLLKFNKGGHTVSYQKENLWSQVLTHSCSSWDRSGSTLMGRFLLESIIEVFVKSNGDITYFCSRELLCRCTNIVRKAKLPQRTKLRSPSCFLLKISWWFHLHFSSVQSRNKFFKKQIKVLASLDTTGEINHHLVLLKLL